MPYRLIVRSFAACVFAAIAAPSFAARLPAPDAAYSATATYQFDNDRYTSTVIADHGRERRVVKTTYGPQTVLVNFPQGKAYLLQAIGAISIDMSSAIAGVDVSRLYTADAKSLGRETIDGIVVTKFRLTANPADNTGFTGLVWASDDGILVKIDGTGTYRGQPGRIRVQLGDIRRGPQNSALLEIPKGMPIMDANAVVKQFLNGKTD
jgi:hypothetical protein